MPIQTIALMGIGGSGKTTIARHYARSQKANLIWEINAESKETLRKSFENLAQAMSQTEEDQKALREMQEISDVYKKEKKFVEFVKMKLKSHSKWFLIYDNVGNFADIQTFFPGDEKTWGAGKIILTTRDAHIQTNSHVKHVIFVHELTAKQSLSLYLSIIYKEKNEPLMENLIEIKKFLEKIPPFPLDITIAAYYLKATNITYNEYLARLNKQNKDFLIVQENLLKEAANYTHSRYSLITLSLKNIITTHKDFAELLLYISLLDSQHIPRKF